MTPPVLDKAYFNSAAQSYDRISGGCTRRAADHLLTLLPTITSSSIIHDNACGPGVVTAAILKHHQTTEGSLDHPPRINATDNAEGMIAALKADIAANGWGEFVQAEVLDSSDLSTIPDAAFTHSIMNFGLFSAGDTAAKEMYRTLRPGGVAAVTTWKWTRNLELTWDVQRAIRPDLPLFLPVGKEWLMREKLEEVLASGGFEREKMRVEDCKVVAKYRDLDEMVETLSTAFGEKIREGWSEEERGRWDGVLRELLTDKEKENAEIEMVAWVAVVEK